MDAQTPVEDFTIQSVEPSRPVPGMLEEVGESLLGRPRSIAAKYFYDEHGSNLFDQICDTPEYYATRAEQALLAAHGGDIMEAVRPAALFELGSGTSRKTRELLDACPPRGLSPAYWPFDVSEETLVRSARSLSRAYPWIRIHGLVGDYTGGLARVPSIAGTELALFLGGTIGNFPEPRASAFLRELGAHLKSGDHLLMGMDRVKDKAILEAAYNDDAGLTARFNKNVLRVLNRDLGADFDLDAFEHQAVFDDKAAQIEMYLIPRRRQEVSLGASGERFTVEAGERILTEVSRKFTAEDIEHLLRGAGFEQVRRFEDARGWYSLVLARLG